MITSEWPTPERPEWVPFIVQQVEYLRKASVEVDVFFFRGAKNPVRYMLAWMILRRRHNLKHYDVVHAQFGQSGLIALPKQLPLVVTFHGSDLQGDVSSKGSYTFQGLVLKCVSKLVAQIADEIIVVSSALGQFVKQHNPYNVIPCGLNLKLFQPMDQIAVRRKLNLPQDKKLILFGGRPEMPVKRYDLARQAMNLLRDDEIELIALSKVPHDQMPLYLNACDVLLLTSLHEGSPTIVKEALACNLPIVSTDVGDVRFRVKGVEGCIVCNDDSPETIVAALMQVLSCGERVKGRQAVMDLDEDLLTQQVIDVYRKAIAKAKKY